MANNGRGLTLYWPHGRHADNLPGIRLQPRCHPRPRSSRQLPHPPSTTHPSVCSTPGSAASPWRANWRRRCRGNPSCTWAIRRDAPTGRARCRRWTASCSRSAAGWWTRGVKMVVIACNTATAAGLAHAQRTFPVPVIGVVEPGCARGSARHEEQSSWASWPRRPRWSRMCTRGLSGTLDAGITVFSTATPARFVEIAEQGIRMAEGPLENYTSLAVESVHPPAFEEIAREYLEPLRRAGVDTLVLGCTHFPLLKALIGGVMGREVTLISSSTEAARATWPRSWPAAAPMRASTTRRATSSTRQATTWREFRGFGSRVFREPIDTVAHVDWLDGAAARVAEPGGRWKTMTHRGCHECAGKKGSCYEDGGAGHEQRPQGGGDRHGAGLPGLGVPHAARAGHRVRPAEDADTFEGNARIKARAAHEASGGLAALADDSGLVVDALDGRAPACTRPAMPASRATTPRTTPSCSRRWPTCRTAERTARFASTLVFVDEDGSEIVAEGAVEGAASGTRDGEARASATTHCSCRTCSAAAPHCSPRSAATRRTPCLTAATPLRQLRAKLEEAGGANA